MLIELTSYNILLNWYKGKLNQILLLVDHKKLTIKYYSETIFHVFNDAFLMMLVGAFGQTPW